jgi:hypothetical protein
LLADRAAGADLFGRVEGGAAGEDGQPAPQCPFGVVEQVKVAIRPKPAISFPLWR